MPKVKTQEFWWDSPTEKNKKFKVNFHVNVDGQFYFHAFDLPKEIKTMAGLEDYYTDTKKSQIDCKDPKDGINKVRAYVDQYEQYLKDKTEKKVIVYKFLLQGQLTDDIPGDDDGEGYKPGIKHSDISSFRSDTYLGLAMEWYVRKQVEIGGKEFIVDEDGDRNRDLDDDSFKRMDWTAGRESWFNKCEADLKAMLLKIHAMNSMSDTKFVKSIDSGRPLLAAPGGK